MELVLHRIRASPVLCRVAPFVVFLLLTGCQSWLGETGRYWVYLVKTLVAGWMLWALRPALEELQWKLSWEAVAIGVAVFVMWVGLDDLLIRLGWPQSYPKLKPGATPWNPHEAFNSSGAWFFCVVRLAGSALVVPPLEEVFFRSFLYRYLSKPDFRSVAFSQFRVVPFLVTSLVFGLEHREWLAGILCGFAYQGLVCWKNRLGDAIAAHSFTNLLLGLWVIGRGEWHFW